MRNRKAKEQARANISFSSRARTKTWAYTYGWSTRSRSVSLCASGASSHLDLTQVQPWATITSECANHKPPETFLSPGCCVVLSYVPHSLLYPSPVQAQPQFFLSFIFLQLLKWTAFYHFICFIILFYHFAILICNKLHYKMHNRIHTVLARAFKSR